MGNAVSWLAQCFYPEEQLFWAAARYGDVRMIQSRLTPGKRKYLEWQEPYTGRTALLEAAAKGHLECVRLLVEAGADCNAKDLKMNTPLHLACKRGRSEVVRYLLEVFTVNPFEINLRMKTPLDLARSCYSQEEDEPAPYAKCIEILETKFCLYSGWMYVKTDNVLSLLSGISSLNSWTRRLCIVLERGEPDVLELALFSMKEGGSVRPVCPSSVLMYNIAAGMEPTSDPRWFSPKAFTFILRGDQLIKCHYRASSSLQKSMHFAAIDPAGFGAWASFFTHQKQQLADQLCVNRLGHRQHNAISGWVPVLQDGTSIATVAPGIGPEKDEDIRRLQTTAATGHEPGGNILALSPPLPVSAPDWEDCGGCNSEMYSSWKESAVWNAENGSVESSVNELKPLPVVNCGSSPAYSSIGICFDRPQFTVCMPCGHNAVCMKCAEEILVATAECPAYSQNGFTTTYRTSNVNTI